MPAGRKVTIYDIAELAGTSASTVSAVLNGNWRARRIKEGSAVAIRKVAEEAGYVHNMQARALRQHRSGMIGMIIPLHETRFFSSISQNFEREARARNLWPIVVSTLRDPEMEVSTARTLISYRVECLLVTGATDPDAIGAVCDAANVRHVNIDLPGRNAPSVISDNYSGAFELTNVILDGMRPAPDGTTSDIYFIAGLAADHATARRIDGFTDALKARGAAPAPGQINACGYAPELAEAAIRELYQRLGRLPAGLFVNSTIAFEGVVRFFRTLPREMLQTITVGCSDWDPFATLVEFPLTMLRQDAKSLVAEAFAIIDSGDFSLREPKLIKSHLIRD